MVVENLTTILPDELIRDLQFLANFFIAIGGFIIAYIVFNIINVVWNRKRLKEIKKIKELLEEINKKLIKNKKRN